jgi:uncharacterized protein
MATRPDIPLSDAELEELTEFFESDLVPEDAMNVSMLHGYFTALAIGPVTVMPSVWLPLIWGEGGNPKLQTLEQAQHVVELIMRYYNQTIQTFMETPQEFQPLIFEYEVDGKWVVAVEDWCVGFSLGVSLGEDAWNSLIENEESSGMLAPIVAFSMEGALDEVPEGPMPDDVRKNLISLLPEAVQAIHAYWLPTRLKIASGLTAETVPLGGRSKTGRNALCPCGSGKKYKKCCGGAVKM